MKYPSLVILALLTASSVAGALEFDAKKIYREASGAVVLIAASDDKLGKGSMGSGSIVRGDGLVLTNAHVILKEKTGSPFQRYLVILKPERVTGDLKRDTARRYRARLLSYSSELDLAVLAIQTGEKAFFPYLYFSNPDGVETGEPVLAIGHPEQGGLWTLTTGTLSGQMENFQNVPGKSVFQTEASINRGNSGGPLLDRKGRILAVNSNISRRGEDGLAITGINFSIKSSVAVKWLGSVGLPFDYAPDGVKEAGIVPVPRPEPKAPESKPAPKAKEPPPEILTETHPYREEDLFKAVEREMEGLMEEMKGKLKGNARPPVSGDRD